MSAKNSDAFPHHPNDVSPAWLTHRLKTSDLLSRGRIESIEVKPLGGVWLAQSAILKLKYSKRANGVKPQSLFIKIARPDTQFGDVTAGEVEFFQSYDPPKFLPIVRCLDSSLEQNTGMNCLILEDLSHTHVQHPWPLPPTEEECRSIVKSLAQIHAHWWESESLPSVNVKSVYQVRHENIFDQLEKLLPKFLDYIGDRLTTVRKQIMCDVCYKLPELLYHRVAEQRATTLIHGDAHIWNAMLPKNPNTHQPVFIDWEEWTCGVSGFDLAYMMVLQWSQERRERLEMDLLGCYRQELTQQSNICYSFDELIHDYKLGCLRNFIIPSFHLEMGIEPYIWWPYLENLYAAYEDLECEKLL